MGGLAAGIASCPFDCVKACMKGDMERQRYGGFLETGHSLYTSGGLPLFFHGVGWRCTCLSQGFFIVTLMTRAWEQHVKPALVSDRKHDSLTDLSARPWTNL